MIACNITVGVIGDAKLEGFPPRSVIVSVRLRGFEVSTSCRIFPNLNSCGFLWVFGILPGVSRV